MQLPVDIKELVDEMTDIKAARDTPLSLSVYVDEAAPSELAAHVRGAFSSSVANVRLTVTYLDDGFIPHPTDDIAVIVAGTSRRIGPAASAVRAVGVPVMVVTASPSEVLALSEKQGNAIPDADVVSWGGPGEPGEPCELGESGGPCAFDEAAAAALDERMGSWIVSTSKDKRLALAIAFPFMRRPLAKDSVQTTSLQNAAVGLVPLIPGADLPIMTLNQAKMVLQIAAAYGQDMNKDRAKELAAVVVGAYVSRGVVRKLAAAVPILGFAIRTGVAYGSTAALGHAIIEYFEGGENATGVANVAERAGELGVKLAVRAREVAADPKGFALELADQAPVLLEKAESVVPTVREGVEKLVPAVRDTAIEYVPKIAELVGDAASRAADGLGRRASGAE